MRANDHAGTSDQSWNQQKRSANFFSRKKQRNKERSRASGVAGGEGVVFGTELRAIPRRFRFDRRTRPTGADLNHTGGEAGKRKSHEHCEKSSQPNFAFQEECHRDSNYADNRVCRPIPHSAYNSHRLFYLPGGIRADPSRDLVVEKECDQ
jgi:hypothetical protein